MEKLKRLLIEILFPPVAFTAILVPTAAALLIYTFVKEDPASTLTYVSYFLSAYALTLVCVRVPAVWRKAKAIQRKNKYISWYTSDARLRVKLSLYGSLAMNCVYALMQLWLGFVNHSVWFYALSGYYVLLSIMRYFLLREARKNRFGKDKYHEYLLYRLCGVLLAAMNLVLGAIVFYIVVQNRGFQYHYIMTIAMAAYTFFTFTMAIVNLVRYRKYESPVMSASKAISFAAALVSMLSLETAMLTAFGEEDNAFFRQVMTACTGVAVCLTVLATAVFMTVRSTKEIRKIEGASLRGE